jgi:hypothetical protein
MASEPQFNSPSYRQQPNPQDYPIPSNHRSYETVTTASGSGSSAEPGGYQTDPTGSDNSSIERVQSVPRRQPEPVGVNDYGIGFGQGPAVSYQPPSFTVGVQQNPGNMNGNGGGGGTTNYQLSGGAPPNNYGGRNYGGNPTPPAVPQKDSGGGGGGGVLLRKQIATSHVQELRPAQPEKRKSWFARRFSKHG